MKNIEVPDELVAGILKNSGYSVENKETVNESTETEDVETEEESEEETLTEE